MTGRPYVLAETTWETVKDMDYAVAILSWGATEAHNYHLPYGTDVVETDHIAAEAARIAWEKGAKVIVLPTIPFGVNTGQLDIKLDINMNPSTQASVLADVIESLSRQAIPKLAVLNGHGGNDFRQMIRELQPRYPKMFLCCLNWYQVVNNGDFFDEPGDHGGEMETSIMLQIAPDFVLPLPRAGDGVERTFKLRGLKEKWVWAQRDWRSVTRDTGVGNPARASAEKGARYVNAVTRKIAEFLIELAAADLNDLYE